jgi:hypothetical protein
MTDGFEREHEFADNSNTDDSFDFSRLTAENTEPLTGEFTPPNISGSKPRWWESARKKNGSSGKKEPRERVSKVERAKALPRGGLRQPLANIYTGIGMSVMPFDPSCGRMIIENADKCAEALDDLAKTNTAVRNFLIGLCTTSAWSAVVMAHAPIVMAIAMHHVPALKKQQEKMVGEFAEMMANGFQAPGTEEDSE